MSHKLISVIVPIMNALPYLDQCLNSIEHQTYSDLEIILLNDGSTDASLETMKKHAAEDSRITIIDKENEGYGATCNRGLKESHGEWISIIEPDDWVEPTMYADMMSFADTFETAGTPLDIIKTPYWRIWMPDTDQQRKLNCSYRKRIKPQTQPFAITSAAHLLSHHPSIWSAVYRKSFLDEHDIRFREIPGAGWADNPFLLETLCQTDKIGYFDTPYYCYREETPEKTAAMATKNTLLPFERWNDMMDILEHLNVTDENILRAHNSRGFTYMSGVIEIVDLSHSEVYDATKHMFERMDPDLVFSDPQLSPGCKRLFAEIRQIPCPKINTSSYAMGLIKQGFYTLRINGVGQAWHDVKDYMKRRTSRTGGK